MGSSSSKTIEHETVINQTMIESNYTFECIVSGYIKIHFETIYNENIPDSLKSLIIEYVSVYHYERNNVTISYPWKIKDILRTDMKKSGSITYNKYNNELKIHCFGNLSIYGHLALHYGLDTISNYESVAIGNIEISVHGTLFIFGTIATNTSRDTQIEYGGFINIKCNNLEMKSSSRIQARGSQFGGKINIKVDNNMKCWHASDIIATSFNKRKGGNVKIMIANQLEVFGAVMINAGGNINGSDGKINFKCNSINHNAKIDGDLSFFAGNGGQVVVNEKVYYQTQLMLKEYHQH